MIIITLEFFDQKIVVKKLKRTSNTVFVRLHSSTQLNSLNGTFLIKFDITDFSLFKYGRKDNTKLKNK